MRLSGNTPQLHKTEQGFRKMNNKIRTQDTEPNKLIIDLHEEILSELYDTCGISLDQDLQSMEEDTDQD